MSEPKAEEQPKPAEEQKLSPAELKKRAKAEKQARRAAQKDTQAPPTGEAPTVAANSTNGESKGQQRQVAGSSSGQAQPKPKGEKQAQQKSQQKQGEHDSRKQSGASQASLPTRNRRSSQSGGNAPRAPTKKQENKQVELFSHLYTQPRRHTLEGVSKDVHPTVLALGFQISSYEVCGSSARCVAMLLAFKEAIQEYTTPTGTSLARHMTSHFLSPQIDFLKSCRPIAESMGNAIRWLKKLIVEVDPSTPEHEAKEYLCDNIDKFIQERIIVSDQAIADAACAQIKNGSVVLTYAKSSIVEKTILQAHAQGTRFRVIIVDSRPLFEGRNLATSLMNTGLEIEYLPFSGIARAVSDATVVLLGAHSMLSNGRLQSRVGTASIAMAAHRKSIPVLVLCQSVKFSGKVALDSIVLNEVAPAEELLPPAPATSQIITLAPKASSKDNDEDEVKLKSLRDWKEVPNLQILNLMYDITPAEYIRMVITEYGSLPPTSIPVVHRLANEGI